MEVVSVALPENLENMSLPSPEAVNYWRLAENRIFYLDYEITECINEIQKAIVAINISDKDIPVEDRKKILIMINSPGGLLSEATMLCQTIIMSKTPVVTVNMNIAYSAACLILLAGHERYSFRYARQLIHSGSTSGGGGTFEQTEAAQKDYKKQVEEMGEYILERTNISPTLFKRQKSKDWYIYNKEAIELGIIDREIESLDEII